MSLSLRSIVSLRSILAVLACASGSVLGAVPALARAQQKPDPVAASVDRALAFLKSVQDDTGCWHASGDHRAPMTSFAVLAFLSAGHMPGEGPYGSTIEKGIRAVLSLQQENGLLVSENGPEMYHHGISTLMLAGAAGTTDRPLSKDIHRALEKAVKLLLHAQRKHGYHKGGWRYTIDGDDADMSVSGWQLLALRAAKNTGCDIPAERIAWGVDFVKRCRDPSSGGFFYVPGSSVTLGCTGTGVVCLALCEKDGHRSREALQGGSYLLKHLPQWNGEHFFYSIYYGSQAAFQLGNNYWNFYRPHLHEVLLPQQNANGAWLGQEGLGPAYATSLAIMSLTVEYRFLPIYQRGEEPGKR